MFRFANENDRESLIKLWFDCFGDGEKFVSPFLDTFLEEDNVYVWDEEGKVVSVVYSLDCKIGENNASYFYAIATDENFRKRGLAKKEIEFLIDYKSQKGTKLFLLTPSNEKNRNYYNSLGFEDFFFCKKETFFKGEIKDNIEEEKDAEEIKNLREEVFGEFPFVSFPKKHIDFALRFSDKVFVKKEKGKTVAYALTDGKKITELCCKENKESFVSAILEKTGEESVEIYVPLNDDSCKISRGMVYCYDKEMLKNLSENTFLSLNLE